MFNNISFNSLNQQYRPQCSMNNINFFQINLKKLLTLNKSSIIYIYG